jgi:hypothetical protein
MYWRGSWEFGIPLIVLTVVAHVTWLRGIILGLRWAPLRPGRSRLRQLARSVIAPGVVVFLVTVIHALEAGAWALAYVTIGVLPDPKKAMEFALSAMTAYGVTGVDVAPDWQMLAAIESLNGLILFGLTTAFLFGVIEREWRNLEEPPE